MNRPSHEVFAGVELEDNTSSNFGLKEKKYSWKNTPTSNMLTPYNLIKQTGQKNDRRIDGQKT